MTDVTDRQDAAAAVQSIEVSADYVSRLNALAEKSGQPVSELVGEALQQYLEAAEPEVDELVARIAQADAGGPFVEHEVVAAWLDTWGTEHEKPPPW